MTKNWLDFGWPWKSRSRSNQPQKLLIGHISATVRDRLGIDSNQRWYHCPLFAMYCDDLEKLGQGQLDLQKFQLAKSQQPLEIYTDLWLTAIRDDIIVLYLSCLWWPWQIRSRSNLPLKFTVAHTSVTIKDTDLWLITMRDNVTVQHLTYKWWPWEIRSRSIRPSKFSIYHISVAIKDTDVWLISMRDNVTGHHLPYLWWPWEIRSRSNWP